jgi:hypothetical protein
MSIRSRTHFPARFAAAAIAALLLSQLAGCALIVRQFTAPLIEDVSAAVMKQQDVELVRLGAPSYLILVDGFVEGNPDDPVLLRQAAELYSAYAQAFAVGEDEEQAMLMTAKARSYAVRAASIENDTFARLAEEPASKFDPVPDSFEPGDEELLFGLVSAWAAWLQVRQDDYSALADLPKVEALARRMLELDETWFHGAPHVMVGTFESLVPPALGGRIDVASRHFERAIEISDGKFLPAHMAYARRVAWQTYDRELFDRLTGHVLDTPADVLPEIALVNALARREARDLVERADRHF